MPTGYTNRIQNGEITEFKDFALACARAFGALISMRDDALDAPMPAEILPDTKYHDDHIAAATLEIDRLARMTAGQISAANTADHAAGVARWKKRQEDIVLSRGRYEAMIAKVAAWQPPTQEHIELKKFMMSQLRDSIGFDCTRDPKWDPEPQPITDAEWFSANKKEAQQRFYINIQARHEEIQRAADRNAWLSALRNSLGD